jgi:hypothetical protein
MPDRSTPPRPQADVQQAFEVLLCGFEESKGQAIDQRWLWLEAAHVMGQSGLAMHWRAHAWMLRFSFQLRDWPETAGQFLRLALVPLGHGLGRLPPGNTGRSHVSALRPMEVSTPVADLITAALEVRGANPEHVKPDPN